MDVAFGSSTPNDRDVMIKDDHDYVIKLNFENALKYFRETWNNPEIIEDIECKKEVTQRKNHKKVNFQDFSNFRKFL